MTDGVTLVSNLVEFGRALRVVGVPTTPAQIAELAQAASWVGVEDRERFFRVARAVIVKRREDLDLFETVFRRFFRDPDLLAVGTGRMPRPRAPRPARRLALAPHGSPPPRSNAEERDVVDRAGAYSADSVEKRKRFAEMTDAELAAVRRFLVGFRWDASLRRTRRRTADPGGPDPDVRRLLRETGRLGALPGFLPTRRRVEKPRPVILIADVSGSMERYSRLLLHFFHSVSRVLPDVETFLFGTRLTRITPQLRLRNVDRAVDEVAASVTDWAGGTRIGSCIAEFNREWARRLLRRGAVVVVVSDGCDRGEISLLGREMAALQRRCHRLVWMNPHAGHAQYEPRVAGMVAALPFVDEFLPLDDVRSLDQLARLLGASRGAARPKVARNAARRSGDVARGAESGHPVGGAS